MCEFNPQRLNLHRNRDKKSRPPAYHNLGSFVRDRVEAILRERVLSWRLRILYFVDVNWRHRPNLTYNLNFPTSFILCLIIFFV